MSETEKRSLDAEARDEKVADTVTINSVEGDEALRLVGTARTAQFSEEYNRKLRRKLVGVFSSVWYFPSSSFRAVQDLLIIPLCAAVYFTQFLCVSQL
jgi:hypothetical protein